MIRRPKKINLEAVSDSTNPQHEKHCQSLINDLLRKHPRGPECNYTRDNYKSSYRREEYLVNAEGEFVKHPENCGYSDLVLYRLCSALSIDGSEWDWKHKMRNMFPDLGKSGITQRSRRLAFHTENAYSRTMSTGRPGIYQVTFGNHYGRTNSAVHVYAETSDMAKMVAKVSFGATYDKDDACNARFTREGCPSEIMGLNIGPAEKFDREADEARKRIIELEKTIELMELRSAMVKTYSIAAVA